MGTLRRRLSACFLIIPTTTVFLFLNGCHDTGASSLSEDGADYHYQDHLKLTKVQKFPWSGDSMGSSYYADVMSHAAVDKFPSARHVGSGNLAINAHETNHMNSSLHSLGQGWRFHYLGDGKGAMLKDLESTKAKVRPYISDYMRRLTSITDSDASPISEASNLYQMYLASTTRHKDVGHIFEEWNCYIVDATVSAEIAAGNWQQGYGGKVIPRSEYEGAMFNRTIKFFKSPEGEFVRLGTGKDMMVLQRGSDNVSANIIFAYFGAVASQMIREQYIHYFNRVPDPEAERDFYQFKAVFAMLAERSLAAYRKGAEYPILAGQRLADVVYDYMTTSPETKLLRQHLIDSYDATWTKRVYGFPKEQ